MVDLRQIGLLQAGRSHRWLAALAAAVGLALAAVSTASAADPLSLGTSESGALTPIIGVVSDAGGTVSTVATGVEPVAKPLTDALEPVVEPAAEPVVEPAAEPVTDAREPVVEPAAGLDDHVEGDVDRPVEPVRKAGPVGDVLPPIPKVVEPVAEPVAELIEPVASVTEPVVNVIGPRTEVVEPVAEVLEPVVAGVEPVAARSRSAASTWRFRCRSTTAGSQDAAARHLALTAGMDPPPRRGKRTRTRTRLLQGPRTRPSSSPASGRMLGAVTRQAAQPSQVIGQLADLEAAPDFGPAPLISRDVHLIPGRLVETLGRRQPNSGQGGRRSLRNQQVVEMGES